MNVQEQYRRDMEKIAFSDAELHLLAQGMRRSSEHKEDDSMNMTPKKKRGVLRPLLIAALVLLVAFSAAAAVRFFVPKELSDEIQLDMSSLQTVVDFEHAEEGDVTTVKKVQKTNGLIITFEAIAKGKCMGPGYWTGDTALQGESAYAIFSIRKANGKPFYGNQDGKNFTLPYQAPNFGYNLLLHGYAPNASALVDRRAIYLYEDGNVLFKAYEITDVLPFADKRPYIVINDGMAVTSDILRIDKNGDFYYDDNYKGIRALFDLNLDPALADPEKQAEVLARDPLFTYDEIVALLAAEGRDYDNYTPPVVEESIDEGGAEPTTVQ